MAGAEEFDARVETGKVVESLPQGGGKIKPGFFSLLSPILRARIIYNFSDLVEMHVAGSEPVKGDFSGGDDKEFLLRGEEEQLEDFKDMNSAQNTTTTTPWARVFVWDEWMSDKNEEDMDKVCRGLQDRLYKLKSEDDIKFIGYKTTLDEEGNDVRLACVHYPSAQLEIIWCFQPTEKKWLIDSVSPLISPLETEKETEQWDKNASPPFSSTKPQDPSSTTTQWKVVEQVSANQSTHKLADSNKINNKMSSDEEEGEGDQDYWGRYDRVKTIADASSSSGDEQEKNQIPKSTTRLQTPIFPTSSSNNNNNNPQQAYRIHVQENLESLYKLGASQGIQHIDLVELLISNVLAISKQQRNP